MITNVTNTQIAKTLGENAAKNVRNNPTSGLGRWLLEHDSYKLDIPRTIIEPKTPELKKGLQNLTALDKAVIPQTIKNLADKILDKMITKGKEIK